MESKSEINKIIRDSKEIMRKGHNDLERETRYTEFYVNAKRKHSRPE
jgi:hypothetical protein